MSSHDDNIWKPHRYMSASNTFITYSVFGRAAIECRWKKDIQRYVQFHPALCRPKLFEPLACTGNGHLPPPPARPPPTPPGQLPPDNNNPGQQPPELGQFHPHIYTYTNSVSGIELNNYCTISVDENNACFL